MASCAYCGAEIIFGGVQVGNIRYCRKSCQQRAEEAERNVAQAKHFYERCLTEVRQHPTDPHLRRRALEAGRLYAAWKRHREGGKATIYDETAIANEIEAASAAAASTTHPVQTGETSMSIEQRLERLVVLKGKKLISDEEYEQKRAEILAEL